MGRSVLVLGSGGREHALAWRLAASPSVDRVESAPGNPGMAVLGPCHVGIDSTDAGAVAALAADRNIDLVVIGPEAPLVAGVADALRDKGIAVFGPSAGAARMEASKAHAKEVMFASGAPTGHWVETSEVAQAHAALERFGAPYVVKADGLAAGKGVRIATSLAEAREAVDDALVRRAFGDAGATIVIEEYLEGPERSVFGVCDGTDVVLLSPAQDYKRALDGDQGLNTGGMGAYTPVPGFELGTGAEATRVDGLADLVFRPVLRELAARGTPFRGLLYAGIVDTVDGPKLLEFNVRFGDPETQVILPRLASDLGDLLWSSAVGSVADAPVTWHDDAFVTVVLASHGYPGDHPKGLPIQGLDQAAAHAGVTVFHAGTTERDGQVVTNGGRVLNVTAGGVDVESARRAAYAAADEISWPGVQRRSDIARGI